MPFENKLSSQFLKLAEVYSMQIDPQQRGKLPNVDPPIPYTSEDGRITGWRGTIPGGRPLATPAVVDGRVFLGGGFGSYDFYAFDAKSGKVSWQYQTNDDGPTAAVVEDGYVAFNTESCELEVLTVEGKPVWKRWLGDPLMSMPAIGKGRVYMAYPDSKGDRQHYLACFDLKTGTQFWRTPISGEIITAPTLADSHVYLTTLNGTLYCIHQRDGRLVWQDPRNATSSPVVVGGQCYFSQREEISLAAAGRQGVQQTEHSARRQAAAKAATRAYRTTRSPAEYLNYLKRRARSPRYEAYELADACVGFAFHKGDAKMEQAMKNLGQGHILGIWAYQGSKPFIFNGRLYSALGDTLHCVDAQTEEPVWTKKLHENKEQDELLDSVLTPPALVNDKVFVGTILGEVYCLSAQSGTVIWCANIGEPIVFQPTVAQGRVYVSTNQGSLYCLETDDADDDGWLIWGAGADHNGVVA